ncbi:GntR family transcriptional regulator [Streptomyces sp. NPDC054766]
MTDELRSRIRSGQLRAGRSMPTQAGLADEFGVVRGAVRRALRILRTERLLADVSKEGPARVADHPGGALTGPEARPQSTMAALAPRITAAFAVPRVKIDALCLTAVPFTLAMGEPLREIHAGRIKPASVDVRVLFPFGRGVGLRDTTFVDQSHLWFDALWETISSEPLFTN